MSAPWMVLLPLQKHFARSQLAGWLAELQNHPSLIWMREKITWLKKRDHLDEDDEPHKPRNQETENPRKGFRLDSKKKAKANISRVNGNNLGRNPKGFEPQMRLSEIAKICKSMFRGVC